jgi:hypothetical protein
MVLVLALVLASVLALVLVLNLILGFRQPWRVVVAPAQAAGWGPGGTQLAPARLPRT